MIQQYVARVDNLDEETADFFRTQGFSYKQNQINYQVESGNYEAAHNYVNWYSQYTGQEWTGAHSHLHSALQRKIVDTFADAYQATLSGQYTFPAAIAEAQSIMTFFGTYGDPSRAEVQDIIDAEITRQIDFALARGDYDAAEAWVGQMDNAGELRRDDAEQQIAES